MDQLRELRLDVYVTGVACFFSLLLHFQGVLSGRMWNRRGWIAKGISQPLVEICGEEIHELWVVQA